MENYHVHKRCMAVLIPLQYKYWKTNKIVVVMMMIIIFLHGLGRLTCSGIDTLPSFPGACDDEQNMPVLCNILSHLQETAFNSKNITTNFCGATHIREIPKLPGPLAKLLNTA